MYLDNINKLKCGSIETKEPVLFFFHPPKKFVDCIDSIWFCNQGLEGSVQLKSTRNLQIKQNINDLHNQNRTISLPNQA
jgi:hypothetical protein